MDAVVFSLALSAFLFLAVIFAKVVLRRDERKMEKEFASYYDWPKLKKKPLYRRIRHRFRKKNKSIKRRFRYAFYRRRRRRQGKWY